VDFLKIIQPLCDTAFTQQIIQDAFKERGIWPVNGKQIVN
jgi:hypothetical protein